MDWSIIGGILAGAAAVWAAVYTLVRERAPMRELERVTAVLKDTPKDALNRVDLEVVRDHLSLRINYGYRAPRGLGFLLLGWTGLLSGVVLFFVVFGVELTGEQTLSTGRSILLGMMNGIVVALGQAALFARWRARNKWLEEVQGSGDNWSTERSLV
ncbi:hypothetical protein [Frigoribacterium salinisoli]